MQLVIHVLLNEEDNTYEENSILCLLSELFNLPVS